MTARDKLVAVLAQAGITAIDASASRFTVAVYDEDGDLDREATDVAAARACTLTGFEGLRAGWGGWHFTKGRKANTSHLTGKADPMHY